MKRFLIVDDDKRFLDLVSAKLEKYAQCITAQNGDDALLQFEHHLREQSPFVAIFMDIEMPKMDGHEVVGKMRQIEKNNNINPVESFKLIMLTGHKDVKNISTSFFKGQADGYVYKGELSDKLVPELEKLKLI